MLIRERERQFTFVGSSGVELRDEGDPERHQRAVNPSLKMLLFTVFSCASRLNPVFMFDTMFCTRRPVVRGQNARRPTSGTRFRCVRLPRFAPFPSVEECMGQGSLRSGQCCRLVQSSPQEGPQRRPRPRTGHRALAACFIGNRNSQPVQRRGEARHLLPSCLERDFLHAIHDVRS